jgi:hypothetical protein
MVLHVPNAMFNSVRLKRLVTLCMSGRKGDSFLSLCLCGSIFLCVLTILFFKLWMICNGKTFIPIIYYYY